MSKRGKIMIRQNSLDSISSSTGSSAEDEPIIVKPNRAIARGIQNRNFVRKIDVKKVAPIAVNFEGDNEGSFKPSDIRPPIYSAPKQETTLSDVIRGSNRVVPASIAVGGGSAAGGSSKSSATVKPISKKAITEFRVNLFNKYGRQYFVDKENMTKSEFQRKIAELEDRHNSECEREENCLLS